jgi:hypothetical protein
VTATAAKAMPPITNGLMLFHWSMFTYAETSPMVPAAAGEVTKLTEGRHHARAIKGTPKPLGVGLSLRSF